MTDTLPTPGTMAGDVERLLKEQAAADPNADLARAKALTVGDMPVIQESVEPFVALPRGIMYEGTWHTRAMVRELTGVDEEAMARIKDITEIYDTVLALGTTRVGDLMLSELPLSERQAILGQLLLGERDQLYVGIVRMTYGDEKKYRYKCANCEEEQDVTIFLADDFKVDEVENVGGTEFDFTTSKGDHIVYRPAVGSDQLLALKRKNASIAEQNTLLLSRCIKTVNDNIVVDPLLYARNLSLRDRNELLGALVARQPNVDMSVKFDCVSCREEQILVLGWADLFQP